MDIARLSLGRDARACARLDSRTRRRLRDTRGWTLIEMVVVMSLIVILAGLATAMYKNSVIKAREAVLKEDLFRMRDAIDQYYADKNKYPADIQALVSDGYMREIPKDPFTQAADTWQTFPAEPDPSNPTIEPGVYNIKSGSEGTAIDGSQYADW
jgi:general secretion pathway protein G